ncbi:Single-stranded DNA-binding protein (plasmid) [Acidisarcina polymorpha]|uniref:Single-stranded DNA-binding protein n=2 Tax=Acidisarcina polymorpha TaxID=2211140 RepID=A0A2Z5GB13_9BACT|nr:single-stranded DNA-binding protein [Acidisarcina polymorpha]AXC16403.1 Single-stranded DNA-binding protein [Acidisarcina polymorpha]
MHSFKNNAHLEGNLGKDAEIKTVNNQQVVNFSIAVHEKWEKNGSTHQRTDWFNIEVWGPMTKFAATLKKGDPVIVEGKLIPRRYKVDEVDHFALSIRANSLRKIDYNQPAVIDEPDDAAPDAEDAPF